MGGRTLTAQPPASLPSLCTPPAMHPNHPSNHKHAHPYARAWLPRPEPPPRHRRHHEHGAAALPERAARGVFPFGRAGRPEGQPRLQRLVQAAGRVRGVPGARGGGAAGCRVCVCVCVCRGGWCGLVGAASGSREEPGLGFACLARRPKALQATSHTCSCQSVVPGVCYKGTGVRVASLWMPSDGLNQPAHGASATMDGWRPNHPSNLLFWGPVCPAGGPEDGRACRHVPHVPQARHVPRKPQGAGSRSQPPCALHAAAAGA